MNDVKDQQTEMNRLNNKYRDALSDKVIYYQQLVEALKQLVER